jgi:hypothetical protein
MEHMHEDAHLKHIDAQHAQYFEEYKVGIWTKEEYRKKVRKLMKKDNVSSHAQNLHSSPDWPSDLPSSPQDA